MTTPLSIGDPAPDFALPRDGGGSVSLADFRGRNLVLYFYPKADTPGCTREAQAFSARRKDFARAGAAILGASADSVKAQDAFKQKYDLGIALASDEAREMLGAYGVWIEKSNYGRKYMGIDRSTFLIDADGRIVRIWRKVRVDGHVDAVLAAVKEL